jgi:type II secretory pathway pseudopilin PulG
MPQQKLVMRRLRTSRCDYEGMAPDFCSSIPLRPTHEAMRNVANGGFVLLQLIIALAITVMIAAAVTPAMISYLDTLRLDRGVTALLELNSGVDSYAAAVGEYPRFITYLSRPLLSGDVDSCAGTLTATQRGRWAGPYVSRVVPAAGLPIFIGIANDTLVRSPATGAANSTATLTVRVSNVRRLDAENADVDLEPNVNGLGSAAGIVRWVDAANGLVTLSLIKTITGC